MFTAETYFDLLSDGYLNNRYLSILKSMSTLDQFDMAQEYKEEAINYQQQTFMSVSCNAQMIADFLGFFKNKIIGLLQEILNDALPLDVAFCRLIVLYGYICCDPDCDQYIAFLLYFVLGSCLPSLRDKIKINDPNHPRYHDLYHNSEIMRYLMDSFFPNLNDKTCIKFKYNGNLSMQSILEHIMTGAEYGDASIVPIICDYAQYPNEEFLYFIDNFMWHLSSDECRIGAFVYLFDTGTRARRKIYVDPLPRLLLCDTFIDHQDPRLRYEAHKMAFNKLDTGRSIATYFTQSTNAFVQCYDCPQEFVAFIEFAMVNPWPLIKEAMLARWFLSSFPLSIFFNGNKKEEKDNEYIHYIDDCWCGTMTMNIHSTFTEMIDIYFDKNDSEWMANVLYQLMNCCLYCFNASSETEGAKSELINVLLHYIKREMRFCDSFASMDLLLCRNGCAKNYEQTFSKFKSLNLLPMYGDIKPPPRKRRRIGL
eukprot:345531_1